MPLLGWSANIESPVESDANDSDKADADDVIPPVLGGDVSSNSCDWDASLVVFMWSFRGVDV